MKLKGLTGKDWYQCSCIRHVIAAVALGFVNPLISLRYSNNTRRHRIGTVLFCVNPFAPFGCPDESPDTRRDMFLFLISIPLRGCI